LDVPITVKKISDHHQETKLSSLRLATPSADFFAKHTIINYHQPRASIYHHRKPSKRMQQQHSTNAKVKTFFRQTEFTGEGNSSLVGGGGGRRNSSFFFSSEASLRARG